MTSAIETGQCGFTQWESETNQSEWLSVFCPNQSAVNNVHLVVSSPTKCLCNDWQWDNASDINEISQNVVKLIRIRICEIPWLSANRDFSKRISNFRNGFMKVRRRPTSWQCFIHCNGQWTLVLVFSIFLVLLTSPAIHLFADRFCFCPYQCSGVLRCL